VKAAVAMAVAVGVVVPIARVESTPTVQQSVYRARTDAVAIDVTVKSGRKAITNLTKQDFEIRDRGVVQSILDFDRERLPLDLTLTIDASSSMTGAKRAAVEGAIAQIGAALDPQDRVEVVKFARHVARVTPLAAPPIVTNLTTGSGLTSVLDAVLLSLATAPVVGRRQLNVLLTDADDSASVFTSDVVRETARFSSTQMSFVVARGTFVFGVRLAEIIGTLRDVASTTGGQVVEISSDETLSAAFLEAIDDFRTSYVLRYVPTGVNAPGWHEVTVSVKGKNHSVRARRGYWAR
jgi:hypothetical protein